MKGLVLYLFVYHSFFIEFLLNDRRIQNTRSHHWTNVKQDPLESVCLSVGRQCWPPLYKMHWKLPNRIQKLAKCSMGADGSVLVLISSDVSSQESGKPWDIILNFKFGFFEAREILTQIVSQSNSLLSRDNSLSRAFIPVQFSSPVQDVLWDESCS